MSSPNLTEIHEFAVSLAKQAGKLIVESSSLRSSQSAQAINADSSKKNRVDLVTETDQRVEKFIKEQISKTYPEHFFIGEESFAGGERVELTDAPTWIVDPIDGTTNFVHGFDQVCTSIGFTYQKLPVVGVVFNPFLNKLYSARQGNGAYLNESIRLPLSHPNPLALASLSDALIAVEWGSDRRKDVIEKKRTMFGKLAGDSQQIEGAVMAHSLRSIGSAALNYCYVASGQIDVYQEIGCWSWDVCAGTIIAREAGCKVFGRKGKEYTPNDLMDHYHFVVRAIGDTSNENGNLAQDRIAKEFFAVAEDWDV